MLEISADKIKDAFENDWWHDLLLPTLTELSTTFWFDLKCKPLNEFWLGVLP